LQAGLGLLARDAGLEAPEDVEEPATAVVQPVELRSRLALHHQRNPQRGHLALVHAVEARRGDAHDGHGVAVDEQLPPDHVGRAAHAVLPVFVRDDDHGVLADPQVVGVLDHAAQGGPDAEHAEIGSRDELRVQGLRRRVRRNVHARRRAREHPLEHRVFVLQVAEQGMRHQVAAAPARAQEVSFPAQQDELLRISHRQEAEEHLVGEREDGRVRPHAQCDREQGDGREAAVAQEAARGVSDVIGEGSEHARPSFAHERRNDRATASTVPKWPASCELREAATGARPDVGWRRPKAEHPPRDRLLRTRR
jgi:hypothetical protein